jgi:hypothetical protein
VHSETNIFNLETHEFGSNPPFLKNEFGGSNIVIHFWWEQLALKKLFGGKILVLSGGNGA